ncbi:MAG: response regulator transcription factor [Acidimicrobiales bacterium]
MPIEETMTIRLLLADDHTMVRQSMRQAMEAEGFDVVGEAGDGAEAVALAEKHNPDVVLMDVSMPILDGIGATRRIKSFAPDTQIVMLTMHADRDIVQQAIGAGAVGYLTKDCSIDEVAETIRLAADGSTLVSTGLAAGMLAEARRSPTADNEADGIISKREEEVLQLFATGASPNEVAEQLFISVRTVKNHLSSIYQKLDARDRTQAVLKGVRMGIISLD